MHFWNNGTSRGTGWLAVAALALAALHPGAASATVTGTARGPYRFKVTAPLKSLAPEVVLDAQTLPADVQYSAEGPYREVPFNLPLPKARAAAAAAALEDPVDLGPAASAPPVPYRPVLDEAPAPGMIESFTGLAQANNRQLMGSGFYPPDTVGAASENFYVQMVNSAIAVWDLRQENFFGSGPKMVVTPRMTNVLWKGTGGLCEAKNDGDPIVTYDEAAGRWLVSQFAYQMDTAPYEFHQCIAISRTADPTGSWYAYDYLISTTKFNDYPKFGVWPDGYYLSVNQFDASAGFGWGGAGVVVFERAKMLAGRATARMIYIDTALGCSDLATGTEPECYLGGMLPADLEGVPPLAGTPNSFVQFDDSAWGYSGDQLQIWQMRTNWAAGTASFSPAATLPVAAFDSYVCPNGTGGYLRNCIDQPGTAIGLDAISDRLMYRAQFRNIGFYNAMVLNHTVRVGAGQAGIRWYELRQSASGSWFLNQQGTHTAADGRSRWMGSIAMDRDRNIALGYSLSGADIYPTLAYAGRLSSDPLGTLPQTERIVLTTENGGSQTGTAYRWGDYSSMDVSPDGCTFWYTNEFLRGTAAAEWSTWIGSFSFPSCTPATLRKATFKSTGSLDGWVLETAETSNIGGTRSTGGPLKLGDDSLNRQYKSVLSFNTATLPDSAVVVGGVLELKKKGLVGGDPLTSISGGILVDFDTPFLGTTKNLESLDFQDPPYITYIAQLNDYNALKSWYQASLRFDMFGSIDKTATTQFRLYLSSDDDNDSASDTLLLESGNAVSSKRPRLTLWYYVP